MFARIGRGTTIGAAVRLALTLVVTSTTAFAQPGPPQWLAPADPAVRPSLPSRAEFDLDNNRIDDRLDRSIGALRRELARERMLSKRAGLAAELAAPRAVEAIFSEQVTQQQIDAFTALGGQVRHLFRTVSYGWTGTLPASAIDALPSALGDSLLVVAEDSPARLHMDEATRTGRVRPVWANGFGGAAGGYSGTSDITVGIVDSGVDDSHPDLAGRMAFWKDYSSDKEASPRDEIQHGSHVAGIALGSGGVFGAGPGTLKYTDGGNLDGAPSNHFFLSGVHYPAEQMTIVMNASWLGGGSTLLRIAARTDGVGGGFIPVCTSENTDTSPFGLTCNTLGNVTQMYSTALPQTQNGSIEHYATTVSLSPYQAVGDGFHAFRGVAPGARWAAGKAFTNSGNGTGASIGAAVDDLVSRRETIDLKILNMSLGIIGSPGTDAGLRSKVNTAVNNGVVVVASAGNDGPGSDATNYIDDPGRASLVLTVGATNDANVLTRYTSSGFPTPASDEDSKPDLLAPGGSDYYSQIMSVDSNDSDADYASFDDKQVNDYSNMKGTSMSTPFVAGAAALMIDAMQKAGADWSFSSSAQPLFVKMMLCASATETNAPREAAAGTNPTLGRAAAPKDLFEGYGLMNPDAAIEALTVVYSGGNLGGSTAGGSFDRRAWGRKLGITSGGAVQFTLSVPPGADYDMYLYSGTPDAKGNPVIRASSTNAGLDADETFSFTPTTSETRYLFVKRVSGSGEWSLTSGPSPNACGDGQKTGNEQCDDGNQANGDCCSSSCTYEANNSPCDDGLFCTSTDRCNSTGVCGGSGDPCSTGGECNDSCNEANDDCAAANGTACSSDSNPCTLDRCNGSGSCVHPAGNGGTVCRAANGVCDVQETCSGTGTSCPTDLYATGGTCRASGGICDPAETCTGAGPACPGNTFSSAATTCRLANGACDVAETCTGTSAACPNNGFSSSATVCRASGSVCDAAETCTGTSASCPSNDFADSGTPCRAASGVCDAAETCTGASGACPDDDYASGAKVCRAASGGCDAAETCTGTSNACPPNDFKARDTVCRAAASICDAAETCSGQSASCPADEFANEDAVCRPASGVCDAAETCSGASASCPADSFEPNGSECDDDVFCNGADDCLNGACAVHEGDPCAGPDGDGDCSESCDEGAGECTAGDPNGTPCTDDLFCTGNDFCSDGACTQHSGNPCAGADGDADCTESCSESSDDCSQADPNGGSCDDGDECTENDQCAAGACTGDPSPGCTTTTTLVSDIMCGDLTEDGEITASDSQAALFSAVGSSDCLYELCDYNGDDRITATDSLLILQVAVGQNVPPKCPAASSPASAVPSTVPGSTTSTTLEALD